MTLVLVFFFLLKSSFWVVKQKTTKQAKKTYRLIKPAVLIQHSFRQLFFLLYVVCSIECLLRNKKNNNNSSFNVKSFKNKIVFIVVVNLTFIFNIVITIIYYK